MVLRRWTTSSSAGSTNSPTNSASLLQKKYATTAQVLEAPEMIAAKAHSVLRHYVCTVMPGAFQRHHRRIQPRSLRPLLRRAQRRQGRTRRRDRSPRRPARPTGLRRSGTPCRRPIHRGRLAALRTSPRTRVRPSHLGRPQRPNRLPPVDRQGRPGSRRFARFKRPLGRSRWRREIRPAGHPHREVNAAHRLRRAQRSGPLPRPAHPGGRTPPSDRPSQPHRPPASPTVSSSTTTASPPSSRPPSPPTPTPKET